MSSISMFPYMVLGDESSQVDVVMLAGFPDDMHSGWGSIPDDLIKDYKCRVLCMCFPDHETGAKPKKWGYDCEEIMSMLRNTIDHLVPDKSKKINFVMHNWGSFYGLCYENRYPERVEKLIALDVGVISSIYSPKISDLFKIVLYQGWFSVSYFISQAINFNMGNFIFKLFFLITPKVLHPWPHDKIFHRKDEEVTVSVCYLYYYFWRRYLLSLSFNPFAPVYPKSPTCFIWGKMKGLMYHEPGFLAHLRSLPNSKIIEVQDSGHWIQHSNPFLVTSVITSYLGLKRK